MRRVILLLAVVATVILSGCGPAKDQPVSARQGAPKVTTRWKWDANSAVAASKGLIIHQTGDAVEATFVDLQDGPGFVVAKKISEGRYSAVDHKIIFPPTTMTPEELDMAIKMDVGRVEVSFTPDAGVLHARWTGQGPPPLKMDFVRVQD